MTVDTANGKRTAEIEVLTAEVRALMVGSRQITLSVYRQLDWCDAEQIVPFGRVNDDRDGQWLAVVGKDADGALVRSGLLLSPFKSNQGAARELCDLWVSLWPAGVQYVPRQRLRDLTFYQLAEYVAGKEWRTYARHTDSKRFAEALRDTEFAVQEMREEEALASSWRELPLIVLAGLK